MTGERFQVWGSRGHQDKLFFYITYLLEELSIPQTARLQHIRSLRNALQVSQEQVGGGGGGRGLKIFLFWLVAVSCWGNQWVSV